MCKIFFSCSRLFSTAYNSFEFTSLTLLSIFFFHQLCFCNVMFLPVPVSVYQFFLLFALGFCYSMKWRSIFAVDLVINYLFYFWVVAYLNYTQYNFICSCLLCLNSNFFHLIELLCSFFLSLVIVFQLYRLLKAFQMQKQFNLILWIMSLFLVASHRYCLLIAYRAEIFFSLKINSLWDNKW